MKRSSRLLRSNPLPVIAGLALLATAALPAQEASVKAAEAFMKPYDENGDFIVSIEEFRKKQQDAAPFKKADRNGDGRITMADFLAGSAPSDSERMMMMADRALYRWEGFHTVPRFDFDHDGVLGESELAFLLMTVLDLDYDRVLNQSEIRRSPAPPGLALDPGWFQRDAKLFDANADTVITAAEMRVPDAVVAGLDKNRDGKVALEEIARAQVGVMGGYLARLHEISDLVGRLGKLDKANWLGDPAIFRRLDADKDTSVSAAEFDRYVRALKDVLAMCPDFVTRCDLDGDQKVSRREFAGTDSMFSRMDRNRDGFVSQADR